MSLPKIAERVIDISIGKVANCFFVLVMTTAWQFVSE